MPSFRPVLLVRGLRSVASPSRCTAMAVPVGRCSNVLQEDHKFGKGVGEGSRPARRWLQHRPPIRSKSTAASVAVVAEEEALATTNRRKGQAGRPNSNHAADHPIPSNSDLDWEGDGHHQSRTRQHCRTCDCTDSQNRLLGEQPTVNEDDEEEEEDAKVMEPSLRRTPRPLPASAIIQPPRAVRPPTPSPEPTAYSVRRRVLPDHLLALHSSQGQARFLQALQEGTAASYLPLTMHFANQSDPAFCGITTLLVVLNAGGVDPHTRWKGGWRYFGDEESLLARCCMSSTRIRSHGITLDEFTRLATCQGLHASTTRALPLPEKEAEGEAGRTAASPATTTTTPGYGTLEDFRRDVVAWLAPAITAGTPKGESDATTIPPPVAGVCVTSFGRAGLGQTGEGHFSPLAAYHAPTDSVLVLDVARFKYPPYWVSVSDLYEAMRFPDPTTHLPRGWCNLAYHPTTPATMTTMHSSSSSGTGGEDRRPAHLVPPQDQASWCPLHPAKIAYCPINQPPHNSSSSSSSSSSHNKNNHGNDTHPSGQGKPR